MKPHFDQSRKFIALAAVLVLWSPTSVAAEKPATFVLTFFACTPQCMWATTSFWK